MPQKQLMRLTVRAQMCLRPGLLHVEPELPPMDPGAVLILDGVPHEVPLELVPPSLRSIGSRFRIVFQPWGSVVAVEPHEG
jgi:hypothetical protein